MKNLILTVFLFSNIAIFSQENIIDTILVNKQNLDEVVVTAIRASSNNPVPFKVLDANDISRVNLGQDSAASKCRNLSCNYNRLASF